MKDIKVTVSCCKKNISIIYYSIVIHNGNKELFIKKKLYFIWRLFEIVRTLQSEIKTKVNNMADIETIKNRLKEKNNPQRRMENIINFYKEMKPFNGNVDRIPDIPFVDEETYNNVIVPNLVRCGAIPKNELIIGKTYIGKCRNASEAVWNGNTFTYERTKFGSVYDEDINHFQDDDGSDLFVPIGLDE